MADTIYVYKGKMWKVMQSFVYTGTGEPFTLPAGQYLLMCNGAHGGKFSVGYNLGGLSMGVIHLTEETNMFAYVGGNGGDSQANGQPPTAGGFNGGADGGLPYSSSYRAGIGGGGGTDIRIGEDSLYARVIVAGGGGGAPSYSTSYAHITGTGGGSVGGYVHSGGASEGKYASQTDGYSFGVGQVASEKMSNSSNGSNGAGGGGGGWYGGYAIQEDGNYTSGNGGGGSGYVLTADSYKPEGYLLGEEYYLTDTVLTQGGNNLPYGINRSIIEVIEAQQFIFLIASDSEGYKKFNLLTSAWEYFAPIETELTEEIFTENGVTSFTTDTGLLSQYNILAWDSEDIVRGIQYNVTPSAQRVSRTVASTIIPKNITVDADYSPSDIVLNITASRSEVDGVQYLTLNADIIPIGTGNVKLYAINVYSSQ
jgi:hypothetical protein